ncbi:MAG: glycosyltransferase family 39 protein [Candidatus Eisenbacteria bacterium]|nr:glycosyltransferase family 39 protein [Candidatus Eisenbacteria bacterium]
MRARTGNQGGWLPLLGVTALCLALRLWIGLGVAQSPLLTRPTLADGSYQAAVNAIEERTSTEALPYGSPLYPRALSLLPGGARELPGRVVPVQAACEALTTLLLVLLVRRRFGGVAALAAGLLHAIDPFGAVFAARLIPVSLAALAFTAALYLADRADDNRAQASSGAGWRVGEGIVLAVGTILMPLPFLALLGLRVRGVFGATPKPARLPALAALALPTLLLAGLFIFAHAAAPGGAPALSWGSGVSFRDAFDPTTGGTQRSFAPPSATDEGALRSEAWEALQREGTTGDLLRFFTVRGFQQLVENPVNTLGVLLTKAAATIGCFPVPDSHSPAFLLSRKFPPLAFTVYLFALWLGLGLAGWYATRGRPEARTWTAGGLAVLLACLLGPTSAATRHLALTALCAFGGVALTSGALRGASGVIAGGGVVASLALGLLAPTAKLQNPSEDLRLLAAAVGQQEGARQVAGLLNESLRANERNTEARVALASAYMRDQLPDRAGEELEKSFAADSTHVPTLFSLSRLAQSRSDAALAADYMARIVNQRPNNPLYLNEFGQLLVVMGRIPEAKPFFVRALRLKPDYVVARTNLEGVEEFERRLEDSLYPPEMRLPQGDPLDEATPGIVVAMDQQQWAKADSLISWAERTRPDIVLPHWLRAGYHGRRGENAPAIAALERCQALAPGRPAIVQLLVQLLVQQGDRARAERVLAESIAAAASDPARLGALEQLRAAIQNPGAPR